MKIKMLIVGAVMAVMALLVPRALAQSYYTNTVGYWNTAANWTNGAPGAGANLIFKRASINTNDMVDGSSFGWVDFNTANVTIRQSNVGYSYYFDALTNETGRTTAWAINTLFSNASMTPVIADLGTSLTLSGVITNTSGTALVVTNTGATTISGGIAGTPGLTKYGSGTLTLSGANTFGGGATINAGTLTINNVAALGTGLLTINGGSLDSNSGSPLTNANNNVMAWAGDFTFAGTTNLHLGTGTVDLGTGTRQVTVTKNILTIGGVITNSGSLTKAGIGTLTLSGDNTFAGSLTVNGGVLVLSGSNTFTAGITLGSMATGTLRLSGGDNRLAVNNTLTFSTYGGTLDVTNTRQTLNTISSGGGMNVTGAGGTLELNGSAFTHTPSPQAAALLNMSNLSNFIYNNIAGSMKVGHARGSRTLTFDLSPNTSITASSVQVGGAVSLATTIWNMGTNTTINADTIVVGTAGSSDTLGYSAVSNPVLTLRGSGGGSSRVTTMTVGTNCTTALMDTVANVTGSSVLDARVTTFIIGLSASATAASAGSLNMAGGTLDATTITIGKNTSTAAGQGTLSVAGGTVKASTLTIADHPSGSGVPSGTFVLGSASAAGMLSAQTVNNGAGTATRTFLWNNGTIDNYDASTDLSIAAALTLTNSASGTHVFNIGTARTGTVNSVIAEAEAGCGLVKSGAGLLILSTNNAYSGLTTVSNGTLLVNNASGTGIAGPILVVGGTLGGNGVVAGAVTNATGGTLAPGTSVGPFTAGQLVMNSGCTNTFEFRAGPPATNDTIVVTTASGLTINGGVVKLFEEGTTNSLTTMSTYNLIQYSGTLGGNAASLVIGNPDPSRSYTFGTNANWVTVTVGAAAIGAAEWLGGSGGKNDWDTPANWNGNSVPGVNATIFIGTNGSSGLVDLNSQVPSLELLTFRADFNTTIRPQGTTPGGYLAFDAAAGDASIVVNGGTHTNAANSDLLDAATIDVAASAALTVSGAISNSAGAKVVTKSGGGTLTLSGASPFSGGVTVNAGQLNINNGGGASQSAIGTGTLTINGGTLDNTSGGAVTLQTDNAQNWDASFVFAGTHDLNLGAGAVTLNASPAVTVNAGTLTVGGAIAGSGYGLTKSGNGTLALGGENTYTGGTTNSAGTLALNHAGALGTGAFTISGGALDNTSGSPVTNANGNVMAWNADINFTGSFGLHVGNGTMNLGTGTRIVTVNANTLTVGGAITNSGALTKAGGGTLTLAGANTFSGDTLVSAGMLALGHTNALQGSTLDTAGAGTLAVLSGATTPVIGGLKGGTDLATVIASGYDSVSGLTLNTPSGRNVTYSGVIADGVSGMTLTKSGAGTQTLSGASTFTGLTTIKAGTLKLSGGDNRLPLGGSLTFAAASTLDMAGVSQTLDTLTLADAAFTATITGAGGALTITNAFSLVSSASPTLTLAGLDTFVYGNSAGTNTVGSGGGNGVLVLTMARTNTMTLAHLVVGPALGTGFGGSTGYLNLGGLTAINADALTVGDGAGGNQGAARIVYGSAVNNPVLTLRGPSGGSSRMGSLVVGTKSQVSAFGSSAYVDLTNNVTGGTLDAKINALLIAYCPNNASTIDGRFAMGAGILDATSIVLAKNAAAGGTPTGTLSVNGGTVKVGTLTLGDKLGTPAVTGVLALNSDANLYAGTITNGAGTATRTFTWNSGTINNYDANTNLTIAAGLTLTLTNSAGTHAFNIDTGRTGTVAAVIAESESGCPLVKIGAGLLILATNNTYNGQTTISNGTLLVNNASGTGVAGAVTICNNATFGGTGVVAGAVTNTAGGVIAPGAGNVGMLTVGPTRLLAGSTLAIQINSDGTPTADKLASAGVVDIDGATLSLSDLGDTKYPVVSMPEFVIIQRTGGSGTFANLLQGAYISLGKNLYTINYSGGTGTDIVLNATPLVLGSVYKIR
jgi:fibronectin-binding autotransporter adhesin